MKHFFTLLSGMALSAAVTAQVIPNGGFETWVNNNESNHTYSVPQSWITLDVIETVFANTGGDLNYAQNSVRPISAAHSGASAVEMYVGTTSHGDTISGVIYSVGSVADIEPLMSGAAVSGFQMSNRPANLTGYYKANCTSSEYALCVIFLTKWNTSTNSRDTLYLNEYVGPFPNTATWTQFSFPITYAYAENPDTMLIAFGLLSAGGSYNMNSTFSLDDLALTGNVPIGINEHEASVPTASVFPNPVSSEATFSLPGTTFHNASLEVYDVTGQLVARLDDQSGDVVRFNREGLKAGMYFYNIIEEGELLAKGKLMAE